MRRSRRRARPPARDRSEDPVRRFRWPTGPPLGLRPDSLPFGLPGPGMGLGEAMADMAAPPVDPLRSLLRHRMPSRRDPGRTGEIDRADRTRRDHGRAALKVSRTLPEEEILWKGS